MDYNDAPHPLAFVAAIVIVWILFMIIPLYAATITMNMGNNAMMIIYGIWGLTVLVCLVFIARIKR